MKRAGSVEKIVAIAENENFKETEIKKPKLEVKSQPPTGKEIIEKYLNGDVTAAVTYRKICNALETFESWESDIPKLQLLEQFLPIADAMEARTDGLVSNLLKLKWNKIPSQVLDRFRNFLCELAVRKICYTEIVLESVVSRFVPQMEIIEESGKFKMTLDEEVQNEHYDIAHYIVFNVLKCFPMSAKAVLKCIRKNMPHFTQPAAKVAAYMKNLILFQKYSPKIIRKEVWDTVFERLAKDDAHSWKCDLNDVETSGSPALFAMDDIILLDDVENDEKVVGKQQEQLMEYLDTACTDIITYICHVHGFEENNENAVQDSWLKKFKYAEDPQINVDEIFEVFSNCLETVMLTATHVRHISFIWLFFCSLREKYETDMLDRLWQITCRMPRVPADSRKSQGAAAFLAAFVARAKYVKKGKAFQWLEEMFEWLRRYVDQFGSGSSQILAGLQRHGTFYAVAQSFFVVFAFRYRDFVKNHEMMESIRRWGVGRVVHSQLEPLKYVSRPVALCFSTISRSLQLVYCNHVIPIEQAQKPFEDMFPFDSYHLKHSSEYVVHLMRKFSPLAEDVSILSAALSWNAAAAEKQKEVDQNSGDLDFLDDDDFGAVGFRDRSGTFGQSSLINYSAAPGLKSFGL